MRVILTSFPIFCLVAFLNGCGEKQEVPPPAETNLSPEEDFEMLDEPNLESVEEELLEELEKEEQLARQEVDKEQEVKNEKGEDSEIAQSPNLKKEKKKEKKAEKTAEKKMKNRAASSSAEISGFSPDGKWVIQASILKDKVQAQNLADQFSGQGFPSYIVKVVNPSQVLMGTYFRVRIGPFGSQEDAESFGKSSMAAQGLSYWVDRKANDSKGVSSRSVSSPVSEPRAPAPVKKEIKRVTVPEPEIIPEPEKDIEPVKVPEKKAEPVKVLEKKAEPAKVLEKKPEPEKQKPVKKEVKPVEDPKPAEGTEDKQLEEEWGSEDDWEPVK